MRFILMYLLCGSLWSLFIFSNEDVYGLSNSEEGMDKIKETRDALFKAGVVIKIQTVKRILGTMVFFWIAITWPYRLFELYLLNPIKRKLKKH